MNNRLKARETGESWNYARRKKPAYAFLEFKLKLIMISSIQSKQYKQFP